MFTASALYHRPNWNAVQATRFLKVDHTTIFLMIAGTSTPIALLAITGTLGTVVAEPCEPERQQHQQHEQHDDAADQ